MITEIKNDEDLKLAIERTDELILLLETDETVLDELNLISDLIIAYTANNFA